MPAGYKCYKKITVIDLAELFNVSKETIRRWIKLKRLDPTSISDIIEKLNNRALLDYRMKDTVEKEIKSSPIE